MKSVKYLLIVVMLGTALMTTGCIKPYNKPVWEEIGPSETAFLIPMTGETGSQAKLDSEQLFEQNKISAKRVQIPMISQKTGFFYWEIKYVPNVMLLKVERAPVTREWTETKDGTSTKNEGITAQSKDGIGYLVRVNSTCQIDESNAAKYLYRYRNKTLEQVMDTEIRPMVEKYFVQQASTMTYDEALNNKIAMMEKVDVQVTKFFAERGVTITVLGLKGEFTPVDTSVAKAYASVASANQSRIAQDQINKKMREQANAEAYAAKVITSNKSAYETKRQWDIKAQEVANQAAWIAKWSGTLPTTALGNSSVIYGGLK